MWKRWGDKLRGAVSSTQNNADSGLVDKLDDYPPLQLPHSGPPAELSDQQVAENFDYMIAALPQRLEHLKQLVTGYEISWPSSFTGTDTQAFVIALHRWAGENWSTVGARIKSDAPQRWRNGERSGNCIGFSVVSDVALTLGELIIAQRPSLAWGMDQDPQNRKEEMVSVNRLVLLGHWRPNPANQIEIDIEATVVNRMLRPTDSSERFENTWLQLVDASVRGAYEGEGVV